ncbi:GGDEF domain-containing protein, partial [Citrobacter freundii]|uniref:GGDEF domain-containing protein n=1 Tax=Citrobacter freundii TaxID=546 RepID=UPI0038B8F929
HQARNSSRRGNKIPFRRRIDSSKPTCRQNRCCKNGSDHRFRFLRRPLFQRHSRNYDFFARYGGEEFVLILPGTDTASANKTLEKLRLVVANHEWLLRQLTVSIGLASADLFDDKKQLLEVADQMLYKAKTQGRNQTSVFATL